jgi:hypothetical protein
MIPKRMIASIEGTWRNEEREALPMRINETIKHADIETHKRKWRSNPRT